MKSRFVLVASCLSLLATGSCTSANPALSTDLGLPDLATTSTPPDLSVAPVVDMTVLPPPDMATTPPDLIPGCGFGQAVSMATGTCACDAQHTSQCGGNVYCCGTTQNCVSGPGPRGETRCSPPPVREAAALGFDPVRNNLILRTGGCLNTAMTEVLCPAPDQWTLGQVTWDNQQPATPISPRWGSTMAWLPSKGTLLLFGGQTTFDTFGSAVDDLYSWNGSDWSKLAPGAGPSARAFTAMAYDKSRSVMVLFGGNDKGNNELADTWEYNGTTWKSITPAGGIAPQAREGLGMVYDPTIGRIVVHAGMVAGAYGRDTWTFDGNAWVQLTDNPTIPLRSNFGMAFDEARKVTVLFGGETTGGATLGETWEFDGTTWTKKTPVNPPSKRTKPAMAYDQGRKQMILFGGNSGGLLNDVWAWDGTNWTKLY